MTAGDAQADGLSMVPDPRAPLFLSSIRQPAAAVPGAPHTAAVIARARDGSPEALAELYDQYAPSIYNIALRLLGSTADAEDVVHDVFLGLPESLRTFEARGSFGGWLGRIGARAALMKLRRAKVAARAVAASTADHSPVTAEVQCVDRIALDAAIADLPRHLRTVFVLKDIAGYSHAEIAEMEGISEANSKARLFRARERLRSQMEDG